MLPIITPQDRLSRDGVKVQVWGPPKAGKTFLAWTLPPERTLFIDCEMGMQSLRGWMAPSIAPQSWPEVKNLTCFLAGPDPGSFNDDDYGAQHFAACQRQYGDPAQWGMFDTILIDSTTRIGQWCLAWCLHQPESFTKKGVRDMLGTYGLLMRELTTWAWRLQNTKRLNIILTGGIKQDEQMKWVPMVDGGAALKFPYIFDQIATLAPVDGENRGLICRSPNPWGYPAGSRSPALGNVEPPNLQALISKVQNYGLQS